MRQERSVSEQGDWAATSFSWRDISRLVLTWGLKFKGLPKPFRFFPRLYEPGSCTKSSCMQTNMAVLNHVWGTAKLLSCQTLGRHLEMASSIWRILFEQRIYVLTYFLFFMNILVFSESNLMATWTHLCVSCQKLIAKQIKIKIKQKFWWNSNPV